MQDFYQYACGGVMNKPYIKPINRGAMARKIIKDELDRQNSSDTNSAGGKMKVFYDSCLNSGSQDTRKSWAKLIKDTFDTYQFSDSAMNGTDFNFDLDKTLGYMMKRGFTPFFDIELEVNPDEAESFMISLHPTIPGSPFHNNLARKVCLEEHHSNLPALGNTSYDVTEAYRNFTNCVGTGKGLEARLVRMKDAVVQFELTKSEELLEETLAKTKDFLTDLSEKQPHIPDLIMNLANNDYDDIKHAEDLDNSIIDWVTVLSLFLNEDKSEVSTRKIAMYCERSMNSINGVLKNYYEISKAELNNILVMLWAEWIYTVFVEPVMGSVGEHEYCLNTAISLMEDTASYLYLQAVDPDVKARNEQIDKIAANIKEEGMNKLRNWSLPEPFQAKLETMMKDVIKLDNVKRETATKSMETVSLTGDFLHNTLLLVKHQSTLMKDKLYAGTDEMWRAFARPYDPFGIYNYRLNKIMIPYASQEPFQTLRDVPEYLHYARIGRQISHLMWHGYDTSGIGFELATTSLTGIKSKQNQLKTEYNGAKSYKNPKGLTANYDMTNLTTNEIWADVGSTDLVWQAYLKRNEVKPTSENLVEKQVQNINTRRRRHSVTEPQDFEEKTLPFLDMTPAQLYHLYWAQSYCSDSSDLNMLEVTETRKPPGRERVNFVTKHSEEFKKAFSCTLN
uniref:Peptidase M13 N-terminal domain-containing protein n=1 Tax=Scylla olivacea TaxID=85551 RepID=A0A0P4WBR7_SCYOL